MPATDYSNIFTADAWQRHGGDAKDMAAQDESYVGDPPSAVSLDPAQMFSLGSPDLSEMHAGHFLNALWAIAAPVQGWLPFRAQDIDPMTAGAAILQFPPVNVGWEWMLHRISLSVTGASHAATAAVYVGPEVTDTAPDESYLVDFASALLGDSPSRNISVYSQPIWMTEGDALTIVIAGATGSGQAICRIAGVRRQKL